MMELAILEKLQRIESCEKCGENDLVSFGEESQLMAVFCNKCQWSCGIDDTFNFLAEEEEINFGFRNKTSAKNSLLADSSNWSEPVDLTMYDFIPYENQNLSSCCKSHELRFQLLDGCFSNPEFLILEVTCFVCNSEGLVLAKEEGENDYNDDNFFKSDETSGKESFCFFYCERCHNNETDLFSPVLNDYKDVTAVKCLVCEKTFDIPQSLNSYRNVLQKDLYANLTKVTCYDQIKKGDHIFFARKLGYDHHAIVTAVKPEEKSIEVIEYGAGDGFASIVTNAEIRRSTVKNMFDGEIYKCEYGKEKSFSDEETIRRGESRLGEKAYCLPTNNCEHFATWCKTGEKSSEQVNHAWIRFVPSIIETVIISLLPRNSNFSKYIKLSFDGGVLLQSLTSFNNRQKMVKSSDDVYWNQVAELISESLFAILMSLPGFRFKFIIKYLAGPISKITVRVLRMIKGKAIDDINSLVKLVNKQWMISS